MKDLINWYFEKCRISTILLVGGVVWTAVAWLMLGHLAPVVYVGLHLFTTGIFAFAILRVNESSPKQQTVPVPAPVEERAPAKTSHKQTA